MTSSKKPGAILPHKPLEILVVTGEERARYDALFNQLKVDKHGFASRHEVEFVFLQSGVSQEVLADVWNQCDINRNWKLNAEQFALAMCLIKKKQNINGEQQKIIDEQEESHDASQKNVKNRHKRKAVETEVEKETEESLFKLPPTPWVVTKEERDRYNILFNQLDSDKDGLVSKEEAMTKVFQHSSLSLPLVSHIWNQCDIRNTGSLTEKQFSIAMWLIKQKMNDSSKLKKKERECRLLKSRKKATKTVQSDFPLPEKPWFVGKDEKTRYMVLFHQLDSDKDGFVTKDEIKDNFLQSRLTQQILDLIWGQCDTKKTGKVNGQQFVLAMWLRDSVITQSQNTNNSSLTSS